MKGYTWHESTFHMSQTVVITQFTNCFRVLWSRAYSSYCRSYAAGRGGTARWLFEKSYLNPWVWFSHLLRGQSRFQIEKIRKTDPSPAILRKQVFFFFFNPQAPFHNHYTKSIDYNFASNWPRTMIMCARTTFSRTWNLLEAFSNL